MSGFVIDGLEYGEYPTDEERIERLVADRDAWRQEAIEYAKQVLNGRNRGRT